MRPHAGAQHLRREYIRRVGWNENGLHPSRRRRSEQCAKITRVADLVWDEDEVGRLGKW